MAPAGKRASGAPTLFSRHAVDTMDDNHRLQSDVLLSVPVSCGIAALRMRAGYSVTLVDRLQAIGGRAQVFERGGFRHDAGPTVITAPFLFDELFELFGEKREDHLEFRPLDPWYRFHFHDGQQFDYRPSIEDTNAEIRKFHAPDVKGYERLLQTSKEIFEIGFEKLADRPFTKFWTMMAQVPALLKLRSYKTVAGSSTATSAPIAASGVFHSPIAGRRQPIHDHIDL